jgi:hypothetical protein
MIDRNLAILSILAASVLAATPVQAAGCGKWKTVFGSLSGEGEALNTSYCSETAGQEYSFEITCMAKSLNVRFMPQIEGDGMSFDKVKADYAVDGTSYVVETQFEELDGAFAADIAIKDPLVKAMRNGQSATVTLMDVKAPVYAVPLDGFKKAIGKLIRECRKG